MNRTFKHIHSSGRFDRSNRSLAADVRTFHKLASIVTHTEMSNDRRELVFKNDPDPTWAYFRSGENYGDNECVVEWDTRIWTQVGTGRAIQMTKKQFFRETGRIAPPTHVIKVTLRSVHEPEFILVIMAAHMPLDNTSLRALIWHDVMKNWARWLRNHKKKHRRNPRKYILTGDWNKNFRQVGERFAIARYFRPLGFKAAWAGNVPVKGGTHGPKSLLDGDYSNLRVINARLLPDTPSSDHRPYIVRYAFPK